MVVSTVLVDLTSVGCIAAIVLSGLVAPVLRVVEMWDFEEAIRFKKTLS